MHQTPTYGDNALGSLAAAGETILLAYCTAPGCWSWRHLSIQKLLASGVPPGSNLVMIARRLRCRQCGRSGGHVERDAPEVPGAPRAIR